MSVDVHAFLASCNINETSSADTFVCGENLPSISSNHPRFNAIWASSGYVTSDESENVYVEFSSIWYPRQKFKVWAANSLVTGLSG